MKRSNWVTAVLILAVGIISLSPFACRFFPGYETPEEEDEDSVEDEENVEEDPFGLPALEITLYFRNLYFEPGVSPPGAVVVPVKRNVPALLAGPGEAVIALLEGPTAEEIKEYGVGKVIRHDVLILDLFWEEDLVVVNLSYDDPFHPPLAMHHEEYAFVEALVRTATEFPAADKVWILRDGKPWKGGYSGCCSPLARSDQELQFTIYYGKQQAVAEWIQGTLTDHGADNLLQAAVISLPSPPGTVLENCPFAKLVQKLTEAPEPGLIAPLPADNTALGFEYYLNDRLLTVHLQGSPTESHIHSSILVRSLVYTFTEIPVVERVLVTLNGEAWSDGHVLWDEPQERRDKHNN
jgi:spore germination protein GerM